MISKDKTYRTRDGREVRIYATDVGGTYSVHGAVKYNNEWGVLTWDSNGRHWHHEDSENDLIEVKPRIKREYWVNVYPDPSCLAHLQNDKHSADVVADDDRIACVKVVIDCEEGEGL